ncbi:MAG: filamentous hemagglutinin N-terminal domain-containing protein [Candidatus Omnitrophica bacterium]|jgi:filamentous hemagglutinin family protein|nr:filamentous hemagglutinin N-terminal domain-containing protein [Candidatus Omnitrophota bacterium]
MKIQKSTKIGIKKTVKKIFTLIVIFSFFCMQSVYSLPQVEQVESGDVSIEYLDGNTMQINASDQAIINYSSFDIGDGESVIVILPSSTSEILNRVSGFDTSDIFGNLDCNGIFILVNPAGINIGSSGNIDTAGLILATRDIANTDFLNNNYVFRKLNRGETDVLISNKGIINISEGGFGVLIAGAIENKGTIVIPMGKISLAAGDVVTLGISDGGLISVAIDEKVASTILDAEGNPITEQLRNTGSIQADGGTILLQAESVTDVFEKAINLEGIVRANRVDISGGIVEILADNNIQLASSVTAEGGIINVRTQGAGDVNITEDGVLSAVNLNITSAGAINSLGSLLATDTMNLIAVGGIRSLGELKTNTLIERGASFILGRECHVGTADMDNLDNAVLYTTGNYSGDYGDDDNVLIGTEETPAIITLTGDTTFWADNLADGGNGAFIMSSGSSVVDDADPVARNLAIKATQDSTLYSINIDGTLTLSESQIGSSPTFNYLSNSMAGGLTLSSGAFNPSANFTLGKAFAISGGSFQGENYDTIIFNDTFTLSDGSFTCPGLGSVTINGAYVQTGGYFTGAAGSDTHTFNDTVEISGGTFYQADLPGEVIFNGEVTFTGSPDIDLWRNTTFNANILNEATISIRAASSYGNKSITLGDGVTFTNNGTLIIEDSPSGYNTLTLQGTEGGSVETFAGNDIDYNGHAITISDITYGADMRIEENGETVTLGDSDCIFTGDVFIDTGGTFSQGDYNVIFRGNVGIGDNGGSAGNYISGSGLITFASGTDSQTFFNNGEERNLGNITISAYNGNNTTLSLSSDMAVKDLIIDSNQTLNVYNSFSAGYHNITLSGNFTNNGILDNINDDIRGGSIILDGSSSISAENTTFNILDCAADGQTTTMLSNLWIGGSLSLGTGSLTDNGSRYGVHLLGSGDVISGIKDINGENGATLDFDRLIFLCPENSSQNVPGGDYSDLTDRLQFETAGGSGGDGSCELQGDIVTSSLFVNANNSVGNTNRGVLNTNDYSIIINNDLAIGNYNGDLDGEYTSDERELGIINCGSSVIDVYDNVYIFQHDSNIAFANEINAQNATINVYGDWINNDTFTAGNSTVTFVGSGASVVSGNTTFNNLISNTAGKQLTFTAGSTQTITDTLTLGNDNDYILLRSSVEGTQWHINPQGTVDISGVDVQDSYNDNPAFVPLTSSANSKDSGNNIGWFLATTPDSVPEPEDPEIVDKVLEQIDIIEEESENEAEHDQDSEESRKKTDSEKIKETTSKIKAIKPTKENPWAGKGFDEDWILRYEQRKKQLSREEIREEMFSKSIYKSGYYRARGEAIASSKPNPLYMISYEDKIMPNIEKATKIAIGASMDIESHIE